MGLDIVWTVLFDSSTIPGIVGGLLLCAGLWGIFKKSGVKPWWALVPCAKYYMLAQCAGKGPEGWALLLMRLWITLTDLAFRFIPAGNGLLLLNALQLMVYCIYFIYLIRVCLGLFEVYGARKRWILLWLPLRGIASLIFGWSKKYQPKWKVEDFRRHAVSLSGVSAKVLEEGLTVNIEERTVTESFQKKYLLQDIHMYIKPGSMVLLLGGSGAGKTTFLNAVNGYERAKARIMLNGGDVYGQYKKMQYEIGFVPQQDLMRGSDTVEHTLSDSALLRLPAEVPAAQRRERVAEVMKLFGLEPLADSLAQKLSGGQRKRLSIAMEFISNPSLFILDEPDSGLDGVMARELMEQLRKIADEGKIVIVITHTPDRVVDLFDDVIVLAKDVNRTGRLAYYGPVEEARRFFGKERMEQIVMTINREEDGGEGRADEFITRYAEVQHA